MLPELKESRTGAWVVNVGKHLSSFAATSIGLHELENLMFAGRAGSLLIKLSGDKQEQLTVAKVHVHARACGITKAELQTYLDTLKTFGCIDHDQPKQTYSVLAFTRGRVLVTTARILASLSLSNVEKTVPNLLELCLTRPRLESEIRNEIGSALPQSEVNTLLKLADEFNLLGVLSVEKSNERLFYNAYQFSERAPDIGRALNALGNKERDELNALLEQVAASPGIAEDAVSVSKKIKDFAIAMGLIEESAVVNMTDANLLPEGTPLEIETAAYFQAHGFFVRRGVSLAVSATADATDIDLLAIRFQTPLAEERIVVDCKDRKKPKPFERILWTSGLATFAGAQRKVVVSPKTLWQAREFAQHGMVEILTVAEVGRYLENSRVARCGEANRVFVQQSVETRRRVGEAAKVLLRDYGKLRQLLVVGNAITNFNKAIQILADAGKAASRELGDRGWLLRQMCYDAAAIACVMLLRFAADSKWTPEADWKTHARKRLTFGDIPPQKVQQLVKLALKADAHNLPEPPYVDEILQTIETLVATPHLAVHLPLAIDRLLLGNLAGGGQGSPGEPPEVSALAKRVVSSIGFAANVDANLWTAPADARPSAMSASATSKS